MLLPSPSPKKKPRKTGAAKAPAARLPATAKSIRPIRPLPGTFVDGRFVCEHGTLPYKLYTPRGSVARRMPMVVMLHGCTQSAGDFAAGTGMNALADELGFLVLYPEQSTGANFRRCWNWHRPGDQKRGSGEPAAIAALTLHAAALCRANRARLYIAGISAGGVTAAIVASAYPEIYAALGVHSGLLRDNVSGVGQALAAMRGAGAPIPTGRKLPAPPPTIVFHGDRDDVVHPSNARAFLTRLEQSRPGPLTSHSERGTSGGGRDYTRTLYRTRAGDVLLEDWSVHGSGHSWSGGSPLGSHTDPAGPDASREMIRFFLSHRHRKAQPRTRAA